MTGDGVERPDAALVVLQFRGYRLALTVHADHLLTEVPGHVFDETSLAAAGRSLQEDRDLLGPRAFEHIDFVANGEVEGFGLDTVAALDGSFHE